MSSSPQHDAFNAIAERYDRDFSRQLTIRLQRRIYWRYLDSVLPEKCDILDLNCGTGTDAIHLARKGHRVTGIDIAQGMIAEFERKAKQDPNLGLKALTRSIEDIKETFPPASFDVVLSNFGGLNCLTTGELRKFSRGLAQVLRPGGRFIAMVMPRACVQESLYYLFKGSPYSAFRRQRREGVQASIGEATIMTYYYSPQAFASLFAPSLVLKQLMPVGTLLPPSYLDTHFRRHFGIARAASCGEGLLSRFKGVASVSDHFLIDCCKEN